MTPSPKPRFAKPSQEAPSDNSMAALLLYGQTYVSALLLPPPPPPTSGENYWADAIRPYERGIMTRETCKIVRKYASAPCETTKPGREHASAPCGTTKPGREYASAPCGTTATTPATPNRKERKMAYDYPLSEPEFTELSGFPECRGVLHTPNMPYNQGYRGSNSLKPKFFRNPEHILVKGANAHLASAIFLAYVKGCGYVDSIKAFAVGKKIILNHRIGKRFSNIVEKNVSHKLAQLNFSSCQAVNIQSILISFIKSFQRNIGFYFEQNRAYSKRTVFPNGICLGFLFFIQQNCKHERGIKVIYHNLESVGTRIFVIVSPIQIAWNICIVWNWNNSIAFGERNFTQLGKVYHINNKSSFGFVFNRDFYPIAEVYKPIARLGGFRFLNSGSLHNKNIEKFSEPLQHVLQSCKSYNRENRGSDVQKISLSQTSTKGVSP
jgi:hypothetical protein